MSLTLNVRELLLGHPIRLRYVVRWGTSRVMKPDTVAEHSYYVALYSLLIAVWCQRQEGCGKLSLGTLLARALVHDMEEAISGDFPRPFKHSDPEVKAALDKAAKVAFQQAIYNLFPGGNGSVAFLAADAEKTLTKWWTEGKDDSLEGLILDFADFLCALSFMLQEKVTWNSTTEQYTQSMREYAKRFNDPKYDRLRPLIHDAGEVMEELFQNGTTHRIPAFPPRPQPAHPEPATGGDNGGKKPRVR